MNIFEFIGLPANHRPKNKVFQLVKHFAEVNPKHEEGILHKRVVFPMLGQVKRDGIFAAVVIRKGGDCAIFGRTGEQLTNVEGLEWYYSWLYERGHVASGVYLGELCSDQCSLEVLSGVVNPNRVNELSDEQLDIKRTLYVAFFDSLQLSEFVYGSSSLPYYRRYREMAEQLIATEVVLDVVEIKDEAALFEFADRMIALGHEGAVFKQDVGYIAGAKDWHQMKVVRKYEVDLECIGWEEGTGKYTGHVANLLFRFKDGKKVKAMLGKGWSMKDACYMFQTITGTKGEQPETRDWMQPVGKIFRVYGLQPSSKNGVIRLPKVGDLRWDKTEADF